MSARVGSAPVRESLVSSLRLDLVGPEVEGVLGDEILPQAPSRWYLTGFLVPYEAPADVRTDDTGGEQLELGVEKGDDDDESPEPASARRAFFPSSIGVSVLVPAAAKSLKIIATWGDYSPETIQVPGKDGAPPTERQVWKRTPRQCELDLPLTGKGAFTEIPGSDGLRIVTSIRGTGPRELLPEGTRAVAVFLVNHRALKTGADPDTATIFQARLVLDLDAGFVARPNPRGLSTDDWDEQVADVQYRDTYEFSVGHGVSTRATVTPGACRHVETTWVPTAEVEQTVFGAVPGVELGMEALAASATAEDIRSRLLPLPTAYEGWIGKQRAAAPKTGSRAEVSKALLDDAAAAAKRIQAGIDILADPMAFEAFRIANRVMAIAARQRQSQILGKKPDEIARPAWRPFQLAFILMNLPGLVDPLHADRERVDLLFFPTGGGKTEAYLGLSTFSLVFRRLRKPGIESAGVTVLMRYTLRLLTLDQLSRAATLICALELERVKNPAQLGAWPFEIGLWVGKAATPNRMGRAGDPDKTTARARTIAFGNDDRKPAPIPLENCPWCGTRFTRTSFSLQPNTINPTDLRIVCASRNCAFTRDRALPILAVDEPIYRRLPCFLIATVDKFASLPWVGQTGALLGHVDRFDGDGFYGPCDPGRGSALPAPLNPPELVIQDELHLISGPLGSMAGLYETAIEVLTARQIGERRIVPKIVASTATVRRASKQIRALFGRPAVGVFPPPGPDLRDSFFAMTAKRDERDPRVYVGIAAQGRSPKVLLLRSYLALLGAAYRAYVDEGGRSNPNNPADPYMTLVGYFNSLRELGGSRRIVEDEIQDRLKGYGSRKRENEARGLFTDREIRYEPVELTSRESTSKVADAKRRLARKAGEDDSVDVALATNMISVGLDIGRLGLMVILGQPKATAEYIQASSRVGRDEGKPGLVVTLLNVHKPRDRSHYERFESYHIAFYRSVEATSVTPFAPRAIDRGLAAVAVSMARHQVGALTPPFAAREMMNLRPQAVFVGEELARRAESHDGDLSPEDARLLREKLVARSADLLDAWSRIAKDQYDAGAGLKYNQHEGSGTAARHLLFDPLDPELDRLPAAFRKFRAQRSLRDVEASTGIWVRRPDGSAAPEDEE